MSKMSRVIESTLKHKPYKRTNSDEKEADELMKMRSSVEDETYKLPKRIYHSKVKSKQMFGCQMVIFNEEENTDNIIIYLHGGAYVNEISPVHIYFCDKLAKKANATVFTPIYPLAPNHTYEETYDIVQRLYESLLAMDKSITIMGDSAGGGLSAAFCEYLAVNKLPEPEHLILISPWVDVSMSGDYEEYIDVDPMLGVDGLKKMGKIWAGNLDTDDYRISPLFGDINNLPQTTIFVGTHEIFYPDILKFYEKIKEKHRDVKLFVGEQMSHVYPLYPAVPESKEAFNQIVDILLSK